MKTLTKTLLTATLIFGLPFGVYAASEAVATAHHGGGHDKMASMTPEQLKADLQQRYDNIQDPAMKAEFIKTLEQHVVGMNKLADVMKQFAETHK